MPFRIALATPAIPADLADAVARAESAIAAAAHTGAAIVCFPECYMPGYPWPGRHRPVVGPDALAAAHAQIARAAAQSRIAVVLGTERWAGDARHLTALVVDADGTVLGWQDKVQLDPSEDAAYHPGSGRPVFRVGALTFGVVICHEGFRYPETVRAAVRAGAQLVFHPHYHEADAGAFQPQTFGDPRNTFHEKALLCRAAENACYVATVNCACPGSSTTSAVANPDGTLLCWQPYGLEGILVADLDLDQADRRLAMRLRDVAGNLT